MTMMPRYLLLCLLCVSTPLWALDGIGKLFTTPSERASLDVLRQNSKSPTVAEPEPTEQVQMPAAPPQAVSVQGYVKRGDGKKGTVWVNHQPVQENTVTDDVQVGKLKRDGNQVSLKLSSGKRVNLKAGQIYLPEQDKVSEGHAATSLEAPESSDK